MTNLTALQVKALNEPGRHRVSPGLYLDIDVKGNRSWMYRYQRNGKRTWMGLGAYDDKANSLADARAAAIEVKAKLNKGVDPVSEARERRAAEASDRATKRQASQLVEIYTFRKCAEDWYRQSESGWLNQKHRSQIRNTLRDYAYPYFGDKAVEEIDLGDVRRCLDPIWETKTETASRVRQRIEQVLSYAIVHGKRTTANPALWRGFLEQIYTKPATLKRNRWLAEGKDGHFSALHYSELPSFMQQLKTKPGIAALALQFTILTAVRSGPVRAATWDQINLEDRVWTIPAMHMKAKRPFRAVLNKQAIEVIKPLMGASDYVFPGGKIGKPLSENGMLAVLKRMGRTDITVHGFRSTFRDHIGEETDFDRFVTEFAMAHVVGDSTERAYARGDQLRKRFDIMEAWGNYVMSGSCE